MIPPLIIYILDMKHFRREWDMISKSQRPSQNVARIKMIQH